MTRSAPDDDGDDLPPAEAARARRRDHDATAGARSGMRTGLAKQFKQVLDTQVRRARASRSGPPVGGEDEGLTEPPPKKRGHHGKPPAPHP